MNPKAPIQWGPFFFNEDKYMRPGDNNNGYDDHQKGTEDDDGESDIIFVGTGGTGGRVKFLLIA